MAHKINENFKGLASFSLRELRQNSSGLSEVVITAFTGVVKTSEGRHISHQDAYTFRVIGLSADNTHQLALFGRICLAQCIDQRKRHFLFSHVDSCRLAALPVGLVVEQIILNLKAHTQSITKGLRTADFSLVNPDRRRAHRTA